MPITYHLQNLTYLSEHGTKKNILPSHLLTQHSNTLLLNYRTCTELSHIQDSYGKSVLPTVRIGKCQRKGGGEEGGKEGGGGGGGGGGDVKRRREEG